MKDIPMHSASPMEGTKAQNSPRVPEKILTSEIPWAGYGIFPHPRVTQHSNWIPSNLLTFFLGYASESFKVYLHHQEDHLSWGNRGGGCFVGRLYGHPEDLYLNDQVCDILQNDEQVLLPQMMHI